MQNSKKKKHENLLIFLAYSHGSVLAVLHIPQSMSELNTQRSLVAGGVYSRSLLEFQAAFGRSQ